MADVKHLGRSVGAVGAVGSVAPAAHTEPDRFIDGPIGEAMGAGPGQGRREPHRGRAGAWSSAAASTAARWLEILTTANLPPGVQCTVQDACTRWYRLRLGVSPLTATLEIEVWRGQFWAHLTVAGRTAPPSLTELDYCRDLFLGDRPAVQRLPRRLERIEGDGRTLHVYAPLASDAEDLPWERV